jgi:putative RecB family exonuclease
MLRVSPLKVRVFQTCRLRYRYQYVDRVPARLRPGDTAGSLVHRVLCDFFSEVAREERTPERLVRMFEERWEALSPRYRRIPGVKDLRASCLDQLRRFGDRHDLSARPYRVEPYFQVVAAPGVTLFGRVDRIDEEPDGSLHIIDYKTGPRPGEVDAAQLRLYAIMVEEKLGRPVSRLSFWYLDDGQIWTTSLYDDDRLRIKNDLLASAEEMQAVTEFPPAIAPHCGHCPYLDACEFRAEIERRRTEEGW